MQLLTLYRKQFTAFGTTLFLVLCLIYISQSNFILHHTNTLTLAITADFVITIPFIYFLLIRNTEIPKITVAPLIIFCIFMASHILPKGEHSIYLALAKTWLIPIIELTVISFVISKVYKAISLYKKNKDESFDFFTILKKTCKEIVPEKLVAPLAIEIGVFYYGFIHWKKRKLSSLEYSYTNKSGTISLLYALLFLIIVETFVFHLLLSMWSTLAANILTLLSIYSGLQIFGFLRSMSKRPIQIDHDHLYLKYGIMAETVIPISSIESVEVSNKTLEDKNFIKMSVLGDLESHNLILHLKKKETWHGLYGQQKKFKKIGLFVDEKDAFVTRIHRAISMTQR